MWCKIANFAILLTLVLVAAGCAERPEKDAGIEKREQRGLPSIAAKSPGVPEVGGLTPGDIPLCYSPDLKTLYVMNYSQQEQEVKVIFGDYTRPIDLLWRCA